MYIIYSSKTCPWCQRAKMLLDRLGANYEEIFQKHDDWPTYPAIIKDGTLIGGFTELARSVRTS
jgi:glutaredoxin-related protein